jgi:type VI secretion system ImpM family protein
MPVIPPVTGIFGKVPAHGDFVRRGLPTSFIAPWDAWLQAGIAHARDSLGANWPAAWDQAPAWRFMLPAGACGPDAVAGVMVPSEDMVGRRFPITLAAMLPAGMAPPAPEWFDAVEDAALAGRLGQADADTMAGRMPVPGAVLPPRPVGAAASDLAPRDDVLGVFTSMASPPVAVQAGDEAPALSPCDRAGDVPAVPQLSAPRPDPGSAAAADDILALFSASPRPAAEPCASQPEDGVLAFLIGATGVPGGEETRAGADPAPLPAGYPSEAPSAATEPPYEEPSVAVALAAAPPGPEGGGWWTRGAARVPPMVWALPCLPSAAEFAYLLEAEA